MPPLAALTDGRNLENSNTGGGIGHDGDQYIVWVYVLVCLFLPLSLEATIEIQQGKRIAHTEND